MRQHCQNNLSNTDKAVIFVCVILEQCQELDNEDDPTPSGYPCITST